MSNFDSREVHEVLMAVPEDRKPNELLVLDPEGHTRLFFDPDDRVQVKAAEEVYEAAMLRQFKAFGKDGPKGAIFDPTETRTILTPAIRGG